MPGSARFIGRGVAVRASDRVVLAILAVVVVAFAAGGSGTRDAMLFHAALLLGFAGSMYVAARGGGAAWVPWLRSTAIVVVLFTLYSTLAEPAFALMGGSRDATLAAIDRALAGGHDPALVVAPRVDAARLEFFSAIYGWFIPALYLSILLGCYGRDDAERDGFLLGLATIYALAYLGYLFVPARGPVEHYAFAAPLVGGPLHRFVLAGVAATGGNHGAFPSLHVGATAYLCLYDLARHPLRGMTYLPLVALISVATIVLRYHYLVDILVGLAIAALAAAVALRRSGPGSA